MTWRDCQAGCSAAFATIYEAPGVALDWCGAPRGIPGCFPLRDQGPGSDQGLTWQIRRGKNFLAKAEGKGNTRHSRFLVGVVGKPGTLVLDGLLHPLSLPPEPSQ